MSEIENGTLGLYGTEHSKYNRLMTLGFKGLNRAAMCKTLRVTCLLQSDSDLVRIITTSVQNCKRA